MKMNKLLGIVVLGLLWCNISYCSEWLTYNSKKLDKFLRFQADGVTVTS